MSNAQKQLSEESRKLTYLKLPHLWIIKVFLDYSNWAWQTTQFSKRQKNKEEKITSTSISVIIFSRSSYLIQFNQHQILWTWITQAQTSEEETSHCSNKKFTTPNFIKTKWSEDLPTESIILEDFTPVHLWRPHFGGDC